MTSMRAVTMCVLLGTAGCTSLSTTGDVRTAARDHATVGVPYSLPLLQYEIKLTRTLAQCTESMGVGAAATQVPSLKFTVKAEATPTFVPGERFTLDYRKLAGFTKISSLAVETFPGGTLKSINASAEDRSAEMISGLAKSAIGVAKLALGVPGGSAANGTLLPSRMLGCSPAGLKAMTDLKTKSTTLKLASEALTKVTNRVTFLTEQQKVRALTTASKKELLRKLEEQTAEAKKAADAKTAVENATEALTFTTVQRFPRDLDKLSGFLEVEGADLERFLKLIEVATASGPAAEDNRCDGGDAQDCLRDKLQARWLIEPLTRLEAGTLTAEKGAVPKTSPQRGVFVRPPEVGRLLICRTYPDPTNPCSTTSRSLLLAAPDAMVPQLGQLRFFPFENGMLQNNSLVLAMRENGSIEKFEYKDLKARGEAAATLAADLVGQGVAFADARRKAAVDEKASELAEAKSDRETQIALLQFEVDKLTKQQQLTSLGDTRVVTLQQEIARITKEQELEKLTTPEAVSELSAIKAEEELSNAKAALYRALLAQREAQEALLK